MKPLMKSNVESLVGRTIEWTAEGYNKNNGGKCIIRSVDFSKVHPLTVDTISGDDLTYAYLQNTGLKSVDGSEDRYEVDENEQSFTYSDDFREVMFRDVTITKEDITRLNDAAENINQKLNDTLSLHELELSKLAWPKNDGVSDDDVIAKYYQFRDTLFSLGKMCEMFNEELTRILDVNEGKF